jgi:type VI secretion system protein ImpK
MLKRRELKRQASPAETFAEARFAVFAWVDEMILTSPWPQRTRWQHLMLRYYNTFNAGEEFFIRLQKLPPQANDVREIYYLCLTLGFLGQYAFGDGAAEVRTIKQTLYKQLSGSKGDIRRSYSLLFPEAYQKSVTAAAAPERAGLLWYIAALSAPCLLFIAYFVILRYQADNLIAEIAKQEKTPAAVRPVNRFGPLR